MKKLDAFQHGDGAHCGLHDWYKDGEEQITAAVTQRIPFDTGWYSSKKEIASARIWSEDGIKIKVEVSVSDDFDTEGLGYASTEEWSIDAVQGCITKAWDKADTARDEGQEYEGFRVGRDGRWEETYLVNIGWGENLSPPGDNYHWWGWQYDGADDTVGVPHPDIPVETVQAFEKYANNWAFGRTDEKSLKMGEWEITPWRDERPIPDDPNDYQGMGWIDSRGRP
jgi:hypothetical protein